jgi:hypothetical protein
MNTTLEQTREQKLSSLQEDFATNYAGREYGEVFEPHGTMTECNFGGLLVILSNTGEGVLVWRDWSDTAVDEKLTECEIEYFYDEDTEESEAGFTFEDEKIFLSQFMRING